MQQSSVFERNPTITSLVILILVCLGLYGILSLKIINNEYTENQNKSLKDILGQFFVARIVDKNVGRYIILREFKPDTVHYERPTRDMLQNIAPNSLERKYYKIATDKHGFIGPSEIHANPDLKLVFLGGSTTECMYLEETQRFVYLVGRTLEQQTNKKINSYNGGKSANESLHSINHLINKVLPLEPDYVILMHNINDLVMLRLQGTYGYQGSLLSHVQDTKTLFTRFSYPARAHNKTNAELRDAFAKNLRMFVSIAQINQIKPVLMTQANRVFDDPLYHEFNETIRTVAKKEGVMLIDLAKTVPQKAEFLYDSYHYTAAGSQLAAEKISESLLKQIA